jgi:hypothetical protein
MPSTAARGSTSASQRCTLAALVIVCHAVCIPALQQSASAHFALFPMPYNRCGIVPVLLLYTVLYTQKAPVALSFIASNIHPAICLHNIGLNILYC